VKRLHSPWRSAYIASFAKLKGQKNGCVLCAAVKSKRDDEHRVVVRGRHAFVILNLYPYNSGHCMIVPNRHTAGIGTLTRAESSEIFALIQATVGALERVSSPHGFNVGSNLGRSAGAGIEDHMHFHVVPRWNGDTNFMPVLGGTKVISEAMDETLVKLRKALKFRAGRRGTGSRR
jgi:ATP adenylyltransferase